MAKPDRSGHFYVNRSLATRWHAAEAPQPFAVVVPYRLSGKRGKNDAADAAAICEAVARPSMRFVAPKSLEQQALQYDAAVASTP